MVDIKFIDENGITFVIFPPNRIKYLVGFKLSNGNEIYGGNISKINQIFPNETILYYIIHPPFPTKRQYIRVIS